MSEEMETTVKKFCINGFFEKTTDLIDVYKPGEYLIMEVNGGQRIFIETIVIERKKKEFQGEIKAGSDTKDDGGFSTSANPKVEVVSSKNAMTNYLLEVMGIKEPPSNNIIFITSNDSMFLELPWESFFGISNSVIRSVYSDKKNTDYDMKKKDYGYNIGVFISQSYKFLNESIPSLKEKIKEEVSGIYKLAELITQEETPKYLKISKCAVHYHLNKEIMNNVNINDFDFLHIILHGDTEGNLCFEQNSEYYDQIEKFPKDDFMEFLREKSFYVVFLSYCYSGGGLLKDNPSLAYQMIEEGISKYSIAYDSGVGQDSASEFANYFYRQILNVIFDDAGKDNMENIYSKSLMNYYRSSTAVPKYIPMLYV